MNDLLSTFFFFFLNCPQMFFGKGSHWSKSWGIQTWQGRSKKWVCKPNVYYSCGCIVNFLLAFSFRCAVRAWNSNQTERRLKPSAKSPSPPSSFHCFRDSKLQNISASSNYELQSAAITTTYSDFDASTWWKCCRVASQKQLNKSSPVAGR